MTISRITNIDNKKHIALLDTSSISFMQRLEGKGIPSDDHSVILVTEVVDNDMFLELVQDTSVHIIF